MFRKNFTIASLYIVLAIFSPRMITVSPLAIFDGVDTLTGSHVTRAISWTYHLITNGTKVVTGTVPFPALAFLLYKLPTAVQEITKKLGIQVKDIPKIILDQPDKPIIKRWRRL